ncbi:MAG: hypothetical protein ACRC1P_01520, partial [Cellulosilyticaceae bacterium]
KSVIEDDVIIIGYGAPYKEYTGDDPCWPYEIDGVKVTKHYYQGLIGTIRIGKYNKAGELVELGKLSGMDEHTRRVLTENGDKYIGEVIKIEAMERTADGFYRHGFFKDFHFDKNSYECIID